MPTNDPNAATAIQDYLRLEFTPEPSIGAEQQLNFGWHRVPVRPKKYSSHPFAGYQYNTSTPLVGAGTQSLTMQQQTVFNLPSGGQPSHDHSVYLLLDGTREMTGNLTLADNKLLTASNYKAQLGVTFDGGGSAIQANQQFSIRVENGFTITSWYMMADQSGSITVDVWKDTWANYPPTDADTITGGSEPAISASDKATGGVSGWTTSVADGDVITFNVDSASTIERCTLILVGTKT
jgi:hypothetical protein